MEQEIKNKGEIIIYQDSDGTTNLDVRLENDTVWLTQAQMVMLFDRDRTVITKHINNIFKEGELDKKVVCAKFAHTTRHGHIKHIYTTHELEEIATVRKLRTIRPKGKREQSERGIAIIIKKDEQL